MYAIALFAVLGGVMGAPAGFWITYGILTGLKVLFAFGKTLNEVDKGNKN